MIEAGELSAEALIAELRQSGVTTVVLGGADTHDNDMSQRLVPLATPQDAGGGAYNLVAPATGRRTSRTQSLA